MSSEWHGNTRANGEIASPLSVGVCVFVRVSACVCAVVHS